MRLVRWSFVEERGYAIRTTIIITLLMTLFMTMMSIGSEPIFMANASNPETQRAVLLKMSRSFSFVFFGAYWFVILMGGSMMFHNMQTRQQRIAYMMLPASNAEKYVCRVVLVVLGGILMSAVSFVVADLLQQLFMHLIFGRSHMGSYAVTLLTTLSDIAQRGVRAFDELGPTFSNYVSQSGLRDIFAGTSINPGLFVIFYYCIHLHGHALPPSWLAVRMRHLFAYQGSDLPDLSRIQRLVIYVGNACRHGSIYMAVLPTVHKNAGYQQ